MYNKSWTRGVVRSIIMLIVALLLLFHNGDISNLIWVYSLGVGVLLAAGSHFTRRIMFNRLDLQSIAQVAVETPIGAAIVFFSICLVLISLMWIPVMVVR